MKKKGKRKTGRLVGWDDELWGRRFAELCDFREKFGHVLVPAKWRGNAALGRWLAYQRKQGREGKIEQDRGKRLTEMGVKFEYIKEPFVEGLDLGLERMLARLVAYRERYGHAGVTRKRDAALYKWIACQRSYRKAGTLMEYRRKRMEEVGFPWEPVDYRWEQKYVQLCDYKTRFGHTNVPSVWRENKVLGHWVVHQRKKQREGTLSAEYRRRLKKLGFCWEFKEILVPELDEYMERMLARLVAYRERYGHVGVTPTRDRALHAWIANQRTYRRTGVLKEYRRKRMDEAGFPWKPVDYLWEEKYVQLCNFKERFGHTTVPCQWKENKVLGRWVEHQREKKRKGKLLTDHCQRLEKIGFSWEIGEVHVEEQDAYLEDMLARLVEYKKRYGHFGVTFERDPKLHGWMLRQRGWRRQGSLKEYRRKRMDEVGFPWKAVRPGWEERFAELCAFKAKYGHANVPCKWKENRRLGDWTKTQREYWRTGKITEERKRKLDGIGFQWVADGKPKMESHFRTVDEQLIQLRVYKARFGNTRVPNGWSEDLCLARWVHRQRRLFREGRMPEERKRKLDALGFEWEVKKRG